MEKLQKQAAGARALGEQREEKQLTNKVSGAKGKGLGLKAPLDPHRPSRDDGEAGRFKALYEKYRREGCDHEEAFKIAGDVIKLREQI